MHVSINNRLGIGAAAAGCVALALVGLSARGQVAPATPSAPATPPAPAAETFVPPVFSEDFESGNLKKEVWDVRIGGNAPAARGGARGAASQPAASAPGATPAAPAVPPAPAPAAGGPTITVVHDLVAHGKNALQVHTPAGSRAYSFIVAPHLPDTLKSHFFGRAYVQFPKAPPNAHDVFITAGNPGFPTSNFLEIGLRQNKAQLSYQQNGPDVTRGETMIPGPAYPVGKWFCLEWEFNDDPDTIVIWIDGAKVTDNKVDFKGTSTKLVKGFSEFAFGFRSWGNVAAPFDVYYDDIAFGTGRIGPVK